jgi:preprotein translocase subunit SecD
LGKKKKKMSSAKTVFEKAGTVDVERGYKITKVGVKKRRYTVIFILTLVVVAVAIYFIYPPQESTKLGLDLRGGTRVILTAKDITGEGITEEKMTKAVGIIESRIDSLGISEPEINRVIGSGSIIIQMPNITDPQAAIDIIGKTAQLEFRIVEGINEDGSYKLGPVLMTGDMLKGAQAGYDNSGKVIVSMEFTSEGQQKFYEVTSANVGNNLAIVLDNKVESAPVIQAAIRGNAVIENIDTLEEAKSIALVLKTGALPMTFDVEDVRVIGSTLGPDSLTAGLYAGLIGIALVILFMIVYYRGLGVVAFFSLIVYIALFWGLLVWIKAALTLPGIAGMILTIGMALDANIIVYERMKEEIRKGRLPRTAMAEGFRHGWRTILDANVTTLITAGILFYFGTGPIRGFALTLSLGVIISMLTAFIFTRALLELVIDRKIFEKPGFIGARKLVADK